MNKKNFKGKIIKQMIPKHDGMCTCFSDIQLAYVKTLGDDEEIKSFRTNVPIELNLKESYVSDVVVTKVDGTIFVRECVQREHLCRTSMGELLDKSRAYWHSKGIDDWGIIIESEGR